MEIDLVNVGLPLVTLVGGWVGSAVTSKRTWKKEKLELQNEIEKNKNDHDRQAFDMLMETANRLDQDNQALRQRQDESEERHSREIAELREDQRRDSEHHRQEMQRIGVKIDGKRLAIKQAYKCKHYKDTQDCPVIKQEEKNEADRIKKACEECPNKED